MPIQTGDSIPSFKVLQAGAEGPQEVDTAALLGEGTAVLFGVPGAFTPTCSARHLPGFVEQAAALKAKGAGVVACIATNDPFVMAAWGRDQGVGDQVTMLSDGSAGFIRALGLDQDLSARNMGVRSQRFAMIVRGGKVAYLGVEEPGAFGVSGADAVLAQL